MDLPDKIAPLLKVFDERGLLALAFHPNFAASGLFQVNHGAKPLPIGRARSRSHYRICQRVRETPWPKVKAEPMGAVNVGGFPYRGRAIPELYGSFVFGDFSFVIIKPSGQLFPATPSPRWGALRQVEKPHQLDARPHGPGEDPPPAP